LIVCGVDGSEPAKGAVRVARELSRKLKKSVMYVQAVGPEVSEAERRKIGDELDRLILDASESRGAWLLGVRHPVDCLVDMAAEVGASMIVVGSSGPRSSLLGSVSAEVSRRAPCPVVVVPPGADGRFASGRPFEGRAVE
jgi:nucleotide-binding universal stress UspA family protein